MSMSFQNHWRAHEILDELPTNAVQDADLIDLVACMHRRELRGFKTAITDMARGRGDVSDRILADYISTGLPALRKKSAKSRKRIKGCAVLASALLTARLLFTPELLVATPIDALIVASTITKRASRRNVSRYEACIEAANEIIDGAVRRSQIKDPRLAPCAGQNKIHFTV